MCKIHKINLNYIKQPLFLAKKPQNHSSFVEFMITKVEHLHIAWYIIQALN